MPEKSEVVKEQKKKEKKVFRVVRFSPGGSMTGQGRYPTKGEACAAISDLKDSKGCYVMEVPGVFYNAAGDKVKPF